MAQNITRRKWLASASLFSLGYPLASAIAKDTPWSTSLELKSPIKLSSNENPYGPSEKAKAAILETLSLGNRYPNALRIALKEELSKKENLPADHILLAAGSTEILGMLGIYLARKNGKYLTTQTTFPVIMNCTESYGISWEKVALDETFHIDLNRLEDRLREQTQAVYLCNPNNPTGTALNAGALALFCKKLKPHQIALIDEAYIEYTDGGIQNSMAKLIQEYPNVLVIRTFSKIYGLAGLRVGYALGNPALIQEIKTSYPVAEASISSAGLSAAQASLKDQDFVKSSFRKNEATRKYVADQLDEWEIPYTDSQANFIYFPIEKFEKKGKRFRSMMAEHQILCPPFGKDNSNLSRMTIGTQEEMEKVIAVMKKMM